MMPHRFVLAALLTLNFHLLITMPAVAQDYLGCYTDQGEHTGTGGRDLDGFMTRSDAMTPRLCAETCGRKGFTYAGVQLGVACFCGNSYGRTGPSQACSTACAGDRNLNCGGAWANAVYRAIESTPVPQAEGYLGCYKDQGESFGTGGRDLGGLITQSDRMTPQLCMTTCAVKGFRYAGVQAGRACFCGESFGRSGSSSACNTPCAGDPDQTCGGPWANDVYALHAPAGGSGSDRQDAGFPGDQTSTAPVPQYLGCWQDEGSIDGVNLNQRALDQKVLTDGSMTIALCAGFCFQAGEDYAGLQFGRACYCGSVEGFPGGDQGYKRYGSLDESRCNKTCSGDVTQACGGNFANSVWTAGVFPAGNVRPDWVDPGFPSDALAQATDAPDDGASPARSGAGGAGTPPPAGGGAPLNPATYVGCFADRGEMFGTGGRDLDGAMVDGIRIGVEMTIGWCTEHCARVDGGYDYAGLQFGRTCFCGDNFGTHGSSSGCIMACQGNSGQVCGGSWANSVWTAGVLPPQAGAGTVATGSAGGVDPSGATGADTGAGDHPRATPGWIGTDGRQNCISNGREVAAQLSCVAPGAVPPEWGMCADSRTIAVIDAFLSRTLPWPGAEYDCWGRWVGVGPTGAVTRNNCQRPETDGRTRCQYLLDNYLALPSPQLGVDLGTYVNQNVQ